jgi:nitroimidazol reductase NimA-like FMN-containing flavoprotein (pyridoxamine 5'-phosphate oxidase superfamily)
MGETDPEPNSTAVGAAEPGQSTHPATEMLELDRTECLRLLAETGVGRIVVSVSEWDYPVIRPVNYVFDESSQSVLIRSALGSKLHALLRSAKAAFEIDGTDPAGRVGWSVIIVGVSEEITNPAELRRIEGLGLDPWAPGHKDHWIRIRSNVVSGRRIALVAGKVLGYRA